MTKQRAGVLNQKLIFHKSIEKCEHEQDIEQSDSFNPVELENQMTMANLTESLSSKDIQIIHRNNRLQ